MSASRFVIIGVLLALAVLAVACGGGAPAAATPLPPTAQPQATTPPSPGGPDNLVAEGENLFMGSCSSCHGADARGIQGLGKDLVTSDFVHGLSDAELLAFINEGRPADHPDNTTGVAMMPKGGNPALNNQDIQAIVAYIRTLTP
jgi:mono/diheme cytochrome c family protein